MLVQSHSNFNSLKRVAVCRDLLNSTKEETEEELSNQEATRSRRLNMRRNREVLLSSASQVLTFNKTFLPEKERVTYIV